MKKIIFLMLISFSAFGVELGKFGIQYESKIRIAFLGYEVKGHKTQGEYGLEEIATLRFRVYNKSAKAWAKNVEVKVNICGKTIKKSIGRIGISTTKSVSFRVKIPSSYWGKRIEGRATARDRNVSSHSTSFTLPNIVFPSFSYKIIEAEGIKDNIYQPGEGLKIRYKLTNNGERPIFHIKIKDFKQEREIALLNPGISATFSYTLLIPFSDDSISLIRKAPVEVNIPFLGKKFYSINIPIVKYNVKMTLEGLYDRPGGLSSGNNNGEMEKEETIEAKFKILNKSNVTIKDAVLHLNPFTGINPVQNDVPLEDLPPGRSATASVSFYIKKSYNTRIPFNPVFKLKRQNIILSKVKIDRRIKGTSIPLWIILSIVGGIIFIIIVITLIAYFSRLMKTISKVTPASANIPIGNATPVSSPPQRRERTITGADIGLSQEAQKRYVLVREIGKGGMGVVYEAKDTILDRKVALKVMRAEISIRKRERERFLKEARTSARLNHPNIVTLYDIVEDESGQIFLVFEYVDGSNLSHIIDKKGKLPIDESINSGIQVLEGLRYAHSEGIIHRDLKPSNIMITKKGKPKILDFGIARVAYDTIYTFTGQTSGTPAYMAPEQHLGDKIDVRCDIYAFGATLYEMLTGELPFKGADLLAAKQQRKIVPPREIDKDIPEHIEALILQCLEPERENRPRNAEEVIERLKRQP